MEKSIFGVILRKKNSLIAILIAFTGCSSVTIDTSTNAAEGNDSTVILGGCGEGYRNGYLLCRKKEGSSGASQIILKTPKISCDRSNCVQYHLIGLDGSVNHQGGVVKGKTETRFTLSDLVGVPGDLEKALDGEYLIVVRIYYKNDGEEYSMISRAFIRLVILKSDYQPLGCNDPAVGWELAVNKMCKAQFTTGFRTAMCCGS